MSLKCWAAAALACAVVVPASAHVGVADPAGYYWVDDREEGFEFVDPRYDNTTPLPLIGGATAPVPLPFVVTLYGRRYDHAEATADGRLMLRWLGSEREIVTDAGMSVFQRSAPREDVAVLDVFAGVRPAAGSQIVLSQAPTQLSVRWVSFESAPREAITFEAQLRFDGRVRFQYWQMRQHLIGPNFGLIGRVALNDPNGGPGVVLMDAGRPVPGFDLRTGSVVEFPNDGIPRNMHPMALECPPANGLPPDAANWCERSAAGPDRVPGTGDENPDCVVNAGDGTHTSCTQGNTTQWLFREGGQYCQNCPYTFYVVVDCGTDMHMPTADVEAMQVQITDMNTGLPRTIVAENECARRASAGSPYIYCDGCDIAEAILAKDRAYGAPINKPAGSCTANTPIGPIVMGEIPCLQYRETGTTVAWGTPTDQVNPDQDGSGFIEQDEMDTPPCTPCGIPPCTCGTDTNANRVTEVQIIDVILYGTPTLTGVFRLEILSGGLEWQLYTNCDGSEDPQYPIFDRCEDALRDYTPLPELSLSEDPANGFGFQVVDSSGCPATLRVSVTVCNSGGAPTASAPFTIRYQDAAGNPVGTPFEGDVATATDCTSGAGLPLDSDECRTCFFDIAPGAADLTAILDVDYRLVVVECSEDATATRCTLGTGDRRRPIPACSAACVVEPDLQVPGAPFCAGSRVVLDANRSIVSGCAGIAEYQFEVFDAGSGSFVPLPGGTFSASSTYVYAPPSGSHRVRVVVRCSTEPGTCQESATPVNFVVQPDSDGDGIGEDCGDNCPTTPNPRQEDADLDFVGDACDNCAGKFNPGQEQSDGDPLGDECDNCRFSANPGQENADADTLGNACDNCPTVINDQLVDLDGDGLISADVYGESPQSDLDADLVGDLCDNCPLPPGYFEAGFPASGSNPLHRTATDCNGDGDTSDSGEAIGEQCDQDGDGMGDICDNCVRTPNPRNDDVAGFDCDGDGLEVGPGEERRGELWLTQCDRDADGVGDPCDNCLTRANPTQTDDDDGDGISGEPGEDDGVGNACDACPFLYNPIHPAAEDCNADGDVGDPGEQPGAQCPCVGCAFPPPEVLRAVTGDPYMAIEKSTLTPAPGALLITSRESTGIRDYTADLFGQPIASGLLEKFNVYRGTIASLRQPLPYTDPSRYDHGCVGDSTTPAPPEPRPLPFTRPALGVLDASGLLGTASFYYLVVGSCADSSGLPLEGEYGWASPDGTDRSQAIPAATTPCP